MIRVPPKRSCGWRKLTLKSKRRDKEPDARRTLTEIVREVSWQPVGAGRS